jgi:hypothetical protein
MCPKNTLFALNARAAEAERKREIAGDEPQKKAGSFELFKGEPSTRQPTAKQTLEMERKLSEDYEEVPCDSLVRD